MIAKTMIAKTMIAKTMIAKTMVAQMMVAQMTAKGIAWPRFERTQMADLIAFLNSTKGNTL